MNETFSGFYGIDKKTMAEHRFTCNNSKSVYKSQVCNRLNDCEISVDHVPDGDNSDEQMCGNIFMILISR